MERPKVTHEIIAAAATALCSREGWDDDQAADLVDVFCGAHQDGYELAKALDMSHGWMPTAYDVDALDGFGSEVREAHRMMCIAWARDNNVQPPLPIGSMTTRGEITGIYAYDGACYEIKEVGDTNPSRRLIVRFEDARAITNVAA